MGGDKSFDTMRSSRWTRGRGVRCRGRTPPTIYLYNVRVRASVIARHVWIVVFRE